jgi:hypothetical protein
MAYGGFVLYLRRQRNQRLLRQNSLVKIKSNIDKFTRTNILKVDARAVILPKSMEQDNILRTSNLYEELVSAIFYFRWSTSKYPLTPDHSHDGFTAAFNR